MTNGPTTVMMDDDDEEDDFRYSLLNIYYTLIPVVTYYWSGRQHLKICGFEENVSLHGVSWCGFHSATGGT